jgi:HK97 family phage portal protein
MLDGLRNGLAAAIGIVAQRLSTEPRYVNPHRVERGLRTVAGVTITPDTAVQVATVWACLRYLSQTVAVLPWHVKRDGKNGAEIQPMHGVDYLLWKRPNPEWSSFQFRESLAHWALRYGNGYAEIERDQLGRPFALWPIHPERTVVCRDPDTQKLYYRVSNTNTSDSSATGAVEIAAEDMFHIRGFGEGPLGVNVIDYASQSIGWARAAQLFGASFFGNGMNVSGVVVNKKPLKPEGLKRQKAEFEQIYKGPRNANKTAFLDNDADWKAIGLDPQKSQLIEVHQFLVEEICRWFGVPPHKVMHLLRATFTNIESQGIEVVVDSISPWVKRFEDEADWKLFGQNRQGLYTKIDMRGLMRGDATARSAYYKSMREMGAYSVNRILELEDENTIGEDGDVHTMNGTYKTLEQIIEGEPAALGAPAPGPAGDPDENDPAAPPAEPGEDEPAVAHLDPRMKAIEAELCPAQ